MVDPPDRVVLLKRAAAGDLAAEDELFWIICDDLRRNSPSANSVHEAFSQIDGSRIDANERQRFYVVASRAMRWLMVDGEREQGEPRSAVLGLDRMLQRLNSLDQQRAQVAEMHFFANLSEEEIADILQLSLRVVRRQLSTANTWLFEQTSFAEEAKDSA
jgi:hypothetical protein